jgi:hypothetical protein
MKPDAHLLAQIIVVFAFSLFIYYALAQGQQRHFRFQIPAVAFASLIVFCAALVRLCLYLRADASYFDESLLRMAVYGWSPRAPFEALQFQTAPPLFVAVSKAITTAWRADEYGCRLVPLVSSVLLFPVLYYAASMLWSRAAGMLAVLLAFSHFQLFAYSAVFKQYESDALITAALLALAGYFRRHGVSRESCVSLALAGIISLLLSQTAFIVLLILLLFIAAETFSAISDQHGDASIRKRATILTGIVTCALLWGAVAVTSYLVLYQPLARSTWMQLFWSDSYLSLFAQGVAGGWKSAAASLWGALPGSIALQAPLLLLGIYGAAQKRDFPLILLIIGPILITTALGVVHLYPVAPRLWLFLAPSTILGASIGTTTIWHIARTYLSQHIASVSAAVCSAFLLVIFGRLQLAMPVAAARALRGFMTSPTQASIARGAVFRILQQSSCDSVYIASRGVPSWFFFSSQFDPDTARRFAKMQELMQFDSPTFFEAPPEAIRLPAAGEQLNLQSGCRTEIYGFASGTPNRARLSPQVGRRPIPGWAQNEVDRIASHSGRSFWLYLGEAGFFEVNPILEEVKRRQYKVTEIGIPGQQFTIYHVQKSG